MNLLSRSYSSYGRRYGNMAVLPILLLVGAFAAFLVMSGKWGGFQITYLLGAVAALIVYLITMVNIQIGIALMMFGAALSPKIYVGGGLPLTIEDFLIPVVFFAWITRMIEHREEFRETDLKTPIFLYLFFTGVSTLYCSLTVESFKATKAISHYFKYCEYFLIFVILLNNIRTKNEARIFILTLVFLAIFTGAGAMLFNELSDSQILHRKIGPEGSGPNEMAGLLGYLLVILLSVFLYTRDFRYRMLLFVAIGVMLHPILFSLSRTSWIAILVGASIIGLWKDKRIFALIVIAFAVLSLMVPEQVKQRAESVPAAVTGKERTSLQARYDTWKRLIPEVSQKPLLGWGKGYHDLGHTDNEYMLQILEGGIVGLVLFMTILWIILRTAYRLTRMTGDPLVKSFAMGVFAGTIMLMVHAYAATSFTVIKIAVQYYFTVGILFAVYSIEVSEARKRAREHRDRGAHRHDEMPHSFGLRY